MGDQTIFSYPTPVDYDSNSRNYETTGATTYLYLTRLNRGSGHLDRDLIRFPATISAAR